MSTKIEAKKNYTLGYIATQVQKENKTEVLVLYRQQTISNFYLCFEFYSHGSPHVRLTTLYGVGIKIYHFFLIVFYTIFFLLKCHYVLLKKAVEFTNKKSTLLILYSIHISLLHSLSYLYKFYNYCHDQFSIFLSLTEHKLSKLDVT